MDELYNGLVSAGNRDYGGIIIEPQRTYMRCSAIIMDAATLLAILQLI